ncbi:metallophosphoesterase family protein [bacterium]|nr:metallophosphoesterase family protein [bacterium]
MRAEPVAARYAIFGDVHGNLEALNAVLESMKEEGITHYACVGDTVGYGANPVECVQKIQALRCKVVLGNHDAAVVGRTDTRFFNSAAREAVEWSRDVLDDTSASFLSALPYVARTECFTLAHASLGNPEEWTYIFSRFEAESFFHYQEDPVCFVGHTHIPSFFSSNTMEDFNRARSIRLKPGTKYIVNVGSVGQPRDGNPLACYAVYDLVQDLIKFVRVPYDIETAQRKIIDAGLPHGLAMRLGRGK